MRLSDFNVIVSYSPSYLIIFRFFKLKNSCLEYPTNNRPKNVLYEYLNLKLKFLFQIKTMFVAFSLPFLRQN